MISQQTEASSSGISLLIVSLSLSAYYVQIAEVGTFPIFRARNFCSLIVESGGLEKGKIEAQK